jgi:hypothetical protein
LHRLAALLLIAPLAAAPASPARRVAAFTDDAGDTQYPPPGDSEIREGDFDLRRFEVSIDGADIVLEVTLSTPFRQPGQTARATVTPLPLISGIYLQNIDVYIDADGAPGSGEARCIPGRRVAFEGGRGWEAAVVLTPQPGATRNLLAGALGEAARRVVVPDRVHASGRTVRARVPIAALGGRPLPSWGWSVHVSGARWDRSFEAVGRLTGGKPAPDAFTMPVLPIAEAWAFGGAPEGDAHPQVIDVLLPRGADQKAVLGSFDAASGAFARVPFVSLRPAPAIAAPAPPPAPGFRVVDVDGETVTLAGDPRGIQPMMIGRVLDVRGATVGRVVVARVLEAGVVATIVEGRAERGAAVQLAP